MDFSIIICTHNRAASLKGTIFAAAKQKYSLSEFEVIIVDNASTDDTKEIVGKCAEQLSCFLKYVFEPNLGLSNARNAGVASSQGEIVVFTDDDAIPDSVWLANLKKAFDDSAAWAAGGAARPVWPNGKAPHWLHPSLYKFLGLTSFASDHIAALHYPEYPYGVNIAFRRDKIIMLGGFSSKLGRKGANLLSGEEVELCRKINQNGAKVVYAPGANVSHVIEKKRLEKSWFKSRSSIQGVSKAIIEREGATGIKWGCLVTKRLVILIGSTLGVVSGYVFQQKQFAFLCECKVSMSMAYLRKMFTEDT